MLALLLILIGGTGTVLVWKDAYISRTFAQQVQPLEHSTAALAHMAMSAEATWGGDAIRRIRFDIGHAGVSRVDLVDKRSAYIDADGTVLTEWAPNGRIEDWLLDLHHRLLARTTGLYVVGFTGIGALVMLLTGLITHWPNRRRWFNNVVPSKLTRASVLRSHRQIGFLLLLPLFVVLLSGVVLTFPDKARPLFYSTDSDTYGESFGDGVDLLTGRDEAGWPRVLSRAAAVFPDATIMEIRWSVDGGDRIVLLKNAGNWSSHGDSQVHITEFDGMMGLRIDSDALPAGEKTFLAMRPLHTASFIGVGGWFYKLMLSLAGIGMVYLGMTGFIFFVKSRISAAS